MHTPICSLHRGARGLSHSAAAIRTVAIQPTRHSSPTRTAQRHVCTAVLVLFSSLISSLNSGAALPPEPPKGVSVLNSGGRALRDGILSNCNVDMISLGYDWAVLEPSDGTYVWSNGTQTGYLDGDLT